MTESPSSSDELRILAERCRSGDEDAAKQLYERFVERLVALARLRISQRLARRIDPEDIVQSAFRTFFLRLQAGEYTFAGRDDICKLLMRITLNKTLRQIAYQRAAKRNAIKETAPGPAGWHTALELMDHEPTPEEAVTFLDAVEHYLARLRPEDRQIIELRLQGHGNEEIARQLCVSDRKIRRIMERIRGQAELEDWFQRRETP